MNLPKSVTWTPFSWCAAAILLAEGAHADDNQASGGLFGFFLSLTGGVNWFSVIIFIILVTFCCCCCCFGAKRVQASDTQLITVRESTRGFELRTITIQRPPPATRSTPDATRSTPDATDELQEPLPKYEPTPAQGHTVVLSAPVDVARTT